MRKSLFAIFALFSLIFASSIYADTATDITKLSAKQLNELPKEKIDTLPAIETMAKIYSEDEDFKKSIKIPPKVFLIGLIEAALNNLKFYYKNPTGKDNQELEEAIKQFQASINKTPTGVLSMAELSTLMKNQELTLPRNIALPGFSEQPSVYRSGDYVSAEGTWVIVDENIAYPIQISKIRCIKSEKTCIEANAYIAIFDSGDDMLNVEINDYYITKWSNEEITADTSGGCRVATLIINTKLKEVSTITRNHNDGECEILPGKSIPKLEKPRVSRLIGGYSISRDYYNKQTKERLKVYSPEYSAAIEELAPNK